VVMPQIKDSKTLAAAGAETIVGLRPSSLSAPAAASPETFGPSPVAAHSRRKTSCASLRRSTRAAGVPGAVGAIVRREGFTRRRCRTGRRQRAAGAFDALSPAKRGPKPLNQTAGGGTCAFAAGEPPAEAAVGARRNDHRTPKKSCGVAGPPSGERRRVFDGRPWRLWAPGSGFDRRRLHSAGAVARQPSSPSGLPETAACNCAPRPTPMRALVAKSAKSYSTC